MLFREIMAVYRKDVTIHKNSLFVAECVVVIC
jgi:hypothetical protein